MERTRKSLSYDRGFDTGAFMEYMEKQFELGQYGISVVLNVLEYAHKNAYVSKDMFAYFVSDMLPEVSFREVAAFCADGCLTKNGIYEKDKFWEEAKA